MKQFICLLAIPFLMSGQPSTLILDSCYQQARNNYPLIRQLNLLEQSKEHSLSNASRGFLPQVVINGQATYQSDVTQVPISLPGLNIPTISKNQSRIYGEISQSLTDGFIISDQKELIRTTAEVEKQKTEVELYKVRERVNELYFGILLLDAQLKQVTLLRSDLDNAVKRSDALLQGGVATHLQTDLLNAEIIKVDQREIELKHTRRGYLDMLGLFTGRAFDDSVHLSVPAAMSTEFTSRRPELLMFENQRLTLNGQTSLIKAKNLPRVQLFFQGGYGRPALNMLSNEFKTYYITGIRFSWNLTGFYTMNQETKIVKINQDIIETQKQSFVLNLGVTMKRQNTEVSRLQQLIARDKDAIELRERISKTANAQLANGTITAIDYLTYVNASDQARQNLAIHEIQLLMAIYQLKITSGN